MAPIYRTGLGSAGRPYAIENRAGWPQRLGPRPPWALRLPIHRHRRLAMETRTLGRTRLEVGRLGMAASFGVPAASVERAFDYLYWGTFRRGPFGQALCNLKPQRDRMVLVLQSYSRVAALMTPSVEIALRKLKFDHADVLLLGMWNAKPPQRILDACAKLRDRGLIRHVAISVHHRPLAAELDRDPGVGIVHVRYNAVHKGAESEVFPQLQPNGTR